MKNDPYKELGQQILADIAMDQHQPNDITWLAIEDLPDGERHGQQILTRDIGYCYRAFFWQDRHNIWVFCEANGVAGDEIDEINRNFGPITHWIALEEYHDNQD